MVVGSRSSVPRCTVAVRGCSRAGEARSTGWGGVARLEPDRRGCGSTVAWNLYRVSLVTLGYADFERVAASTPPLGWSGDSPDGEVVFIQAGPMIVALWDRAKLAADSTVTDGGGWAASPWPTTSGRRPRSTRCWPRPRRPGPRSDGRVPPPSGAVTPAPPRSRRPRVGDRPQPVLDDRRRRFRLADVSPLPSFT